MSAAVDVEILPCGHASKASLFEQPDGTYRLLTLRPKIGVFGSTPGAVWCVTDGWQAASDEQHEAFKAVVA